MIVHVHMIVTGRLNINCRVESVFFDVEGKRIQAADTVNTDGSGQALVWRKIKPNYPSTEYKDFKLFVPTSAFHALSKGSHDLNLRVRVVDQASNTVIGQSDPSRFILTL